MQKKKQGNKWVFYTKILPLCKYFITLATSLTSQRSVFIFINFPQIKKNMAGSQDYLATVPGSHLEYAIYVPLHYCKIVTKKILFLSLKSLVITEFMITELSIKFTKLTKKLVN